MRKNAIAVITASENIGRFVVKGDERTDMTVMEVINHAVMKAGNLVTSVEELISGDG